MSGELRVVSEPGLGSSFTVRLPLPVLAATEDGPALLAAGLGMAAPLLLAGAMGHQPLGLAAALGSLAIGSGT
ncbi:hypothetical protein AB4144_68170, partial [Rhizobiaceae sp. 2RAB30]